MFKLTFVTLLVLGLAACATSTTLRAPEVPAKLIVPSGNKVAVEMLASGVQIYTCQEMKDDPSKFEWVLKAPDARLTDLDGRDAGHHSAGPTWTARDGSRVVGKLEQKTDAPNANDIPWLLLSAKSNEGDGELSRVTFIQRLDTQGGKAPKDGADAAHVGQEVRVDYRATYYFYVPGI